MRLARNAAENLPAAPATPETDEALDPRNVALMVGGLAVTYADTALAYTADSWPVDALAVPGGIVGLAVVAYGFKKIIGLLNADLREHDSPAAAPDHPDS